MSQHVVREHPYTDEQIEAFARAWFPGPEDKETQREDCRHISSRLQQLDAAGITVTFPEPRYYARCRPNDGRPQVFEVLDRERRERWSEGLIIASFRADADGERQAQEHADRLNREASR